MKCEQARLDILEHLDENCDDMPYELEEHIDRCENCKKSLEMLEKSHLDIRNAVHFIAPERSYLTPERLEKLKKAQGVSQRRFFPLFGSPVRWQSAALAACMLIVAAVSIVQLIDAVTPDSGILTTPPPVRRQMAVTELKYHVFNDIDQWTHGTAELIRASERGYTRRSEEFDAALTFTPEGIAIPVQDTAGNRHDDYWW